MINPSISGYRLKIGGISYEFPLLLKEVSKSSLKDKLIQKPLGRKDCQNFLQNQQDIPIAWRGKVTIVFMDFVEIHGDKKYVAIICWDEKRWIQSLIQYDYLSLLSNVVPRLLN